MSTNLNPYAAPMPIEMVQSKSGRRPGALTAICVIAIILGGLGLLTSVGGLVSQIFLPWIQSTFSTPATGSGPMQVQAEMQGEMNQVGSKFRAVNIVLAAAQLPLTICLLAGGIMALNGKRLGRKILAGACLAAIAFVVAHTVVAMIVQWQTVGVMSRFMPKMIAAQPGGANVQQAEQMVTTIMSISGYVGMAIVGAIALTKLIYYGLSVAYLNRQSTRAFFGDAG